VWDAGSENQGSSQRIKEKQQGNTRRNLNDGKEGERTYLNPTERKVLSYKVSLI
jgi:hypothetical protein